MLLRDKVELTVNFILLIADKFAMQKSELTILIVEDDQTLGKALKEFISRAGFKTLLVSKPADALAAVKIQPIHAAVIDCMLPAMNGRDLTVKLKEEAPTPFPVILMSGIYKDKNFAREAMQKTGAVSFLTKPFDPNALISEIESLLEDQIDVPLAPLQALLLKHEFSHKERIKAINDTSDVHGFDLPWIFSILMHKRISGHLNIVTADAEVCGVGFLQGNIVQVNQKDAKSYFGVLMVEHGFITQAELDEVLARTGKTKKVGEALVDANVLSPHAIQIVMAEQQGIRLSKTIANTSVKVNFLESDEMREDAFLEPTSFVEFVNEWSLSKFTPEWLKSTYLPWRQHSLVKGPEFSNSHRCMTLPVVQRIPGLVNLLLESETLEDAITNANAPEDQVYRALHALIICRLLRFGEAKAHVNYEAQLARLTKIHADLGKQNYFERLGVSQKAKEVEVKRSYHELAKIFHPDKLPPGAPADVQDLTRKTFKMISEAYETLNDPKKKQLYLLELEKGRAEFILKAERLAEQARTLLTKGDTKKARELMDECVSLAPPTSEIRLLHMWAHLKRAGADKDAQLVEKVRDDLAQIPPEDRHNPLYYFVKGLHLKASGEPELAKKSFEHAVSINPDFIDARRELSMLSLQNNNKPVDLLRGDLKDVVGMLFKKKK